MKLKANQCAINKNGKVRNLPNEIWKDIEGFEGYQISNLGRVKSLNYRHTKRERILQQKLSRNGYCQIVLCKNGKKYTFVVHRLVATAYISNPNGKPQVNHLDECKINNCAENLEWCTCKENINHGTRNERVAKTLKERKHNGRIRTTSDETRKPIHIS